MKVGIVYYSRTGNTKKAAEILKENLEKKNVDVKLIEIIHEKRPGYLKASRAGLKQLELPIKNTDFDISRFDRILVGMPIWAFNPAPYFRSFFSKTVKLKGKKTAIFLTGGDNPKKNAGKAEVASNYLESLGASVLKETLAFQMQKGGKITDGEQNIEEFIQTIMK